MESKIMEESEFETAAMDWIEQVTGEEVDDIYYSLKTGVILCKLVVSSLKPIASKADCSFKDEYHTAWDHSQV
jgi:hypothetical protein